MSNLEGKNINKNFRMADFPDIIESIGQDAWDKTKDAPIGIVAKLVDSAYVRSGKIVHFLLCNQLRVHKKEIWCLVGVQPIRFGLNEFAHITGLNTDPLPAEKFEPEVDYRAFFRLFNVPVGEGPNLEELREGLKVCRRWKPEERKWLGLLLLQAIGIYAVHPNSRIPFESAKRVFDDEAMKTYPWGRSAFEALVDSVKMLSPKGKSYTLSGCVPVLQAWAYESVKCFGERFGNALAENGDIPLLRWVGNRTHSTMEAVIAEEIKSLGELRVRRMVMKDDVSELFHTWADQEDDPALDCLIKDIHGDTFVKGFWDGKKKKRNAGDSESPSAKKQKVHKVNVDKEEARDDMSVRTLVDLVSKLNSRFDTFDTKMIGIVTKIASFEEEMKQMKEQVMSMGGGQNRQQPTDAFSDLKLKDVVCNLRTPKVPRKYLQISHRPLRM